MTLTLSADGLAVDLFLILGLILAAGIPTPKPPLAGRTPYPTAPLPRFDLRYASFNVCLYNGSIVVNLYC